MDGRRKDKGGKPVKIVTSICKDCDNFEHECNEEFICEENCFSKNKEVRERFYDTEEIKECEGFEGR